MIYTVPDNEQNRRIAETIQATFSNVEIQYTSRCGIVFATTSPAALAALQEVYANPVKAETEYQI